MSKSVFEEHGYNESVKNDSIDMQYGFKRIKEIDNRTGYLINMHMNELLDDDHRLVSALDLFFIRMDGSRFKYTVAYPPYFLICVDEVRLPEVAQLLKTKYGSEIVKTETLYKEDLDLPNHLSGKKQVFLKVMFYNQNSLIKVRKVISSAVAANSSNAKNRDVFCQMLNDNRPTHKTELKRSGPLDAVIDIREHDVPYHVRVSIDLKIFCGMWYDVKMNSGNKLLPTITGRPDILERPEPVVLAFDIETTKLPLKFPDAQSDQVIMISYMIDGQGFLITNREIISVDVQDFEYTPRPEFEGQFIVYNEANERDAIQKFFDHINEVCPHIFVTYNGDFFDWPFIEMRASLYGLDMNEQIGFSKSRDGLYLSRPAIHMDCLCWVKRDSYLPVGSQGLKAVAKAKLNYDPIELDPEEMCRMAVEHPQVLSNYSVSDAIATYYLYMKYVHPFIFALATIIPMEPDEILRKGSGTLCETLLMVEAYHANIVFPNKQQEKAQKVSSDGQLIDAETYVGGHVEALECGVYRADIPCRFRLDRTMVTQLIKSTEEVLKHAIEIEEGVPLADVTNFDEISTEIKQALQGLHDIPNRLEQPVIYHLDVGAMYPNIILTNRLQPSALVEDVDCAACVFNHPEAKCKRSMKWHWRGDLLPASKNELLRIKQQLEMENFPPLLPGGSPRAFHELSKEDQSAYEKKRLTEYCRKVYKKTKIVKVEERTSTICQKENSFYVDTVRAFRDRRYDYKKLTKVAKQFVSEAIKKGDAAEVKAAKSKEVLYDSLQLAHKCILNSFYGYVMRKGARWHSMPMAGIVCLTGSSIIQRARNIIERIGRPLELDTDGIWCILPASFPQVFTILSTHKGKNKFNISYPNAVLNNMVKEHYTNDQYHELVKPYKDGNLPEYEIRSENSIFFEVDGPYLAMVLPAAKEEGKKLKKRYAVFNFDGTMAELKGFEVKRRGELQLIKNFQSSVFEAFLSGNTLEECYGSVAKIANYWLDVLYSHGQNLPDPELFDLISENRSMSKKLEDYGSQKSTSISTAKRLAEFLGEQMVKDAGLSCKYVILRKPEGTPVTERAVPLAIFQSEPSIRRTYLGRWLRDTTMGDADIREVVDWNYYIERLNGAIQKIITIPAAIQGVKNPVPRVVHPDWLHRKMKESTDKERQRQITELFSSAPKSTISSNKRPRTISGSAGEVGSAFNGTSAPKTPEKTTPATKRTFSEANIEVDGDWRKALGSPPSIGTTRSEIVEWVNFQKSKWQLQLKARKDKRNTKRSKTGKNIITASKKPTTVSDFIQRSKRSLLGHLWQIINLIAIDDFGNFVIWAIVQDELHKIKINIPRVIYVNQRSIKEIDNDGDQLNRTKVPCILPRHSQRYNVYRCKLQEKDFKNQTPGITGNIPIAEIEGVYETKLSLEARFLIEIGSMCNINKNSAGNASDIHSFENLEKFTNTKHYLAKSWKRLKKGFLYQQSSLGKRQLWGLFLPASKRAVIIIFDKQRANQMPNMNSLYVAERAAYLKKSQNADLADDALPKNISFEIFVEIDLAQVYRILQRTLSIYKEDKRGPTVLCTQTLMENYTLRSAIPFLSEFPLVKIHISDDALTLHGLDWQKKATRTMIRHFLNFNSVIDLMLEQSRYLNVPIGNMPPDPVLIGTDIFFARLLQKNNFILWWSTTNRPDLGGKEIEDYKFLTQSDKVFVSQNKPGYYSELCVSLTVQNLAVSALLQSTRVLEMEGTTSATPFDVCSQVTLDDMLSAKTARANLYNNGLSAASPIFKILRTIVSGWLREVSLNQNIFSDYHIAHFYRWMRSSNAFMYDPAICKAVTNLMEKLFLGLIAEFKRLGTEIIYADMNRIIINTKKTAIEEALSYVEFIVQSIRKKELFHSVHLSFHQLWNSLIWFDATNYAGIKGTLPTTTDPSTEPDDSTANVSNALSINFALESDIFRQEEFKTNFETFVALTLHALQEKHDVPGAFMSISHKIFALVLDLRNKYGNEQPSAVKTFVEAMIKIITIYKTTNDDIINLKRNLLKVIDVNEFSVCDELTSTIEYVLNGVTCQACNEYRDIDLVHDKHRTMRDDQAVWLCDRCYVAYDNRDIEMLITENIANAMIGYTLQDVKCSQCNGIKKDNLSETCNCGGVFIPLVKKMDIQVMLEVLMKVAKSHNMRLLEHTLTKILSVKK